MKRCALWWSKRDIRESGEVSTKLMIRRAYKYVGNEMVWARQDEIKITVWTAIGNKVWIPEPDVPPDYTKGLLICYKDGYPCDLATFDEALKSCHLDTREQIIKTLLA